MNKKFSDLIETTVACVKQLQQESMERTEQRRLLAQHEQQRQRAIQQKIVVHCIRQAKINNDIATLKNIRIASFQNINEGMDFVKVLHKELFSHFLQSYYPTLTYSV